MDNDIYSAENLAVYFSDGNYITTLNGRLARKQKISAEDIEMLKDTHIMHRLIFQAMERVNEVTKLKRLAKMFEDLEFLQQELWKFGKDSKFHRWFDVPKCSCPKLDNADRIGTDFNIYDLKCIIHGGKLKQIETN